jgi:hypothetical protein
MGLAQSVCDDDALVNEKEEKASGAWFSPTPLLSASTTPFLAATGRPGPQGCIVNELLAEFGPSPG